MVEPGLMQAHGDWAGGIPGRDQYTISVKQGFLCVDLR